MANPDPSPSTRFPPGQSGNPSGRPKGVLTEMLREMLQEKDPQKQKTHAELVVRALIRGARRGKSTQTIVLWDRSDGKVKAEDDAAGDDPTDELSEEFDDYEREPRPEGREAEGDLPGLPQ